MKRPADQRLVAENDSPRGSIKCLECNEYFKTITYHVFAIHGMRKHEYVHKHKLPIGYRMSSFEMRKLQQALLLAQPRHTWRNSVLKQQTSEELRDNLTKSQLRKRTGDGRSLSSAQKKNIAQLQRPEIKRKSVVAAIVAIKKAHNIEKVCVGCKNKFIAGAKNKPRDRKYCSRICQIKDFQNTLFVPIQHICRHCGSPFESVQTNACYCSNKCKYKYRWANRKIVNE